MKEFISLISKVYSFSYLSENELITKKTLKGVSKTVVKNEISYKDYVDVLETNNSVSKTVTGIRSFGHQLYTYKQDKIALTGYYDKMFMTDSINCVPFGYKFSNTPIN